MRRGRRSAMRTFVYERASDPTLAGKAGEAVRAASALQSPVQFLAGGTTLVDLMKLDVMRPAKLVDINALQGTALGQIEIGRDGLRMGALVRMADAAEHAGIRQQYPMVAQSLKLAASQQHRNIASLRAHTLQ